jgi:hypothetical protein
MKLKITSLTAACLLILTACTAPNAPAPDTNGGATTGGSDATTESPGGSFNLDPVVGLADRAYTATLNVRFEGTEDGAPYQWSDAMTQTVSLDPPAHALTLSSEPAARQSDIYPPWSAEVDGIYYTVFEDGQCFASILPADSPGPLSMITLAAMLPAVTGAQAAGTETVNGVETTAYTLDAAALGAPEGTTASGTAWVAADGTLMRYTLTVEGGPAYFGEGREGTITYDYQLSDAPAVTLPAECPAGLIDLAHLPDAADLVEEPGATSYTTASDIAAVVAHYQEQLSGSGWEPTGEPLISETTALLDFVLGSQQLSILITTADGVTHVQLVIIPALGEGAPEASPTP